MSLINIEKTVTLDVYDHDTTPSVIKTIQMDTGTRTVFAVIQNSRQDYDIGQNASVKLTVLRPDKTKVQITGQTFVSYTGADGTMYGAKAELSDVALAVKGNLKAQFKITSGEQELRTEIFTINNGEALDAGDGDWAGDLDGHNLDEMAESIETLQTDMAAVNEDVSDLKEGLQDLQDGGYVADAQKIQEKIDKYLDDHPEATTTVQDGSLVESKFSNALKLKTVKDYVTPQMYGAVGDGVTDDTNAIQAALNSGFPVLLISTYGITSITMPVGGTLYGYSSLYQQSGKSTLKVLSNTTAAIKCTAKATIKGISIYCDNKATYGITNFDNVPDYFNVNISNVYVKDANIAGFYLTCNLSIVEECIASNCGTGFLISGADNTNITSIAVNNCYSLQCDIGFYFDHVVYSTMRACACDYADIAYKFERAEITLSSCGCEEISTKCILAITSYLSLDGFFCNNSSETGRTLFIELATNSYVVINGHVKGYKSYLSKMCKVGTDSVLKVSPVNDVARFPKTFSGNLLQIPDGTYSSGDVTITFEDGIGEISGSSSATTAIIVDTLTLDRGTYILQINQHDEDASNGKRGILVSTSNDASPYNNIIGSSLYYKSYFTVTIETTVYIKVRVNSDYSGTYPIYPAILKL